MSARAPSRVAYVFRYTRSFFSEAKKLSTAELSQQPPRRLMLHVMPSAASSRWKSRDCSSPGPFTRRSPKSSFGSRHKRELPGSREHLGLAMTSREWIQHLHVRFSKIVRVSGDDDEIVNERR